jgi:hypothetical protein
MNTVLGYGKIGEYTGPSWELNAISSAIARGLITGDVDLSAPATRQEVIQYVFNTLRPDPSGNAKNYLVEYSDLVHAYIPSGTSAFQGTQQVNLDAYLGARVFGLKASPDPDDFGVNWRTWRQNGKLLVGDNKYLAETVIDDFVTEKQWTGGDLARAYEWDDAADLEVYVNGLKLSSATFLNDITRGSTTIALPYLGANVRLFDNLGDTYTIGNTTGRVDNGKVGKIVITTERLAQVTKVDAVKQTIDFNLFTRSGDASDPGAKKVAVKNFETDDAYAVNDYILVIPKGNTDNGGYGIYGQGYSYTWILADLKAEPSVILSTAPARSEQIQATSYTRANQGTTTTVQLATVTVSGGDKYIVSGLYAFGLGETPSFTAESTLYLDSKGVVVGVTGDTISAASLKYLYVTGVRVAGPDGSFSPARVRVSVIYADTYAADILDLPITRSGNTYYATINGAKLVVGGTADTGTLAGFSGTYAGGDDKGVALEGWYWYTSVSDSKVVSLKSNALIGGDKSKPDAFPIQTEAYGSEADGYGVYGVGTLTAGSAIIPRGIDGGFIEDKDGDGDVDSPLLYGAVRCDSRSVLLYNGIKTTGYSRFPYTANDKSDDGYALAIRGKTGYIDLIIALNTSPTVPAPATYAIIEKVAYEAVWEPGTVLYKVVGSTAAITNAGAYEELADTNNPTYTTGDIVNVQADGSGGYKIFAANGADNGIREYSTVAVQGVDKDAKPSHIVAHVNENHEWFTVTPAIEAMSGSTTVTTTTAIPFLDKYYLDEYQSHPDLEKREYPQEGDVLTLYFGAGAFGPALEAIVITLHNDDPKANQAALDANAQAAVLAAAGNTFKANFDLIDSMFSVYSIKSAALSSISYTSNGSTVTLSDNTTTSIDWDNDATEINTAVTTYLTTLATAAQSAANALDVSVSRGFTISSYTITQMGTGWMGTVTNAANYYGDPTGLTLSWEDGNDFIGYYKVTFTGSWGASDIPPLVGIFNLNIKEPTP